MTAVCEVVVGDDPGAWAAAGFSVDGDHAEVGAVRLTFAPGASRGIRSWGLVGGPDGGDLDGLATTAALPHGRPPPVHANGAVALDHLVVFSPDVDRTTEAFVAVGLDVRRVRPIPASEPPRVQVFFRAGEVVIELVGATEIHGTGPAVFYGLAFTVTDLDATRALLGDRLSPLRPAVQRGRQIATLRHREVGVSVPVAFLSQRATGDADRSEARPA